MTFSLPRMRGGREPHQRCLKLRLNMDTVPAPFAWCFRQRSPIRPRRHYTSEPAGCGTLFSAFTISGCEELLALVTFFALPHLQHSQESLLRNLHAAHAFHALLAFFLLFE